MLGPAWSTLPILHKPGKAVFTAANAAEVVDFPKGVQLDYAFWMMAVAIPLGLVTGAIEVVRYLAS